MPETISTPPSASAETWVEVLRTLADPIRLRIIRLLEQQAQQGGGGGLSVGELADILKLPQSTVSRHLKTLMDGHLAAVRREGTSMLYRLADGRGGAGENSLRQLRLLSKPYLDHDPLTKTDTQRLAHILRQRHATPNQFFGQAASQWDTLRTQWFGATFHLEALLALLNPNWVVADIGTGTGMLLPLLAPHVQQTIGIDVSAAMLKKAKTRVRDLQLANVDLRQGSLEQLPLESASVDVAVIVLVLAYAIDPLAGLKEVRRVLKPNGTLLLVDLQPHTVEFFRDQLHHRWMGFSQPQLEAWLHEANFTLPRYHPLPAQHARTKDTSNGGVITIPDLFALRAQTATS